jgi:hypothetical protein
VRIGLDEDFAVDVVEQPDFFAAGGEVIERFAVYLDGSFGWREDFDGNIGRERHRDSVQIDLLRTVGEEYG